MKLSFVFCGIKCKASLRLSTLIVMVGQILAAGGVPGRVKRQMPLLPIISSTTTTTTTTTGTPMTALESNIITAMDQAYDAINPCCYPSTDCDENLLSTLSNQIGDYHTQIVNTNITQTFYDEYTTQAARLKVLDDTCPDPHPPGSSPSSSPPSTSGASTTSSTTTTSTTTISTTTTTIVECCPEFIANHDCAELCALSAQIGDLENSLAAIIAALTGGRLRMRRARSAPDLEIEGNMLESLKEAFVVIENCVDFNLCNGSHALQISRDLGNIGELFVTRSLTNLSSNFTGDLETTFSRIEGALSKGKTGDFSWRACPTWVLGLNLDDSLMGGLCRALTDLTTQRRQRRSECSQYPQLLKKLYDNVVLQLMEGKGNKTTWNDLYIEMASRPHCEAPADIVDMIYQLAGRPTQAMSF